MCRRKDYMKFNPKCVVKCSSLINIYSFPTLEFTYLFLCSSSQIFKYSFVCNHCVTKIIQLYTLPSKSFGYIIDNFESNFIWIRRERIQQPKPNAHKCQIHLCKPRLACLLGHEGMVISVQNSPNSLTFYLSSVMTFEAQFVCFS